MAAGLVAILAAVVSGAFAVLTVVMTRRAALKDEVRTAEDTALRYRSPLVHAAFDLQTRLWNIHCQRFLDTFYVSSPSGTDREYALTNTLYLIAQYLCYSEIVRRELLYLDPADRKRQQELNDAIECVRNVFSTTTTIHGRTLCIFRGQQRAIGEIMHVERHGAAPGTPQWDCMGYAAFTECLSDPHMARWFGDLQASIAELASDLESHDERLIALQYALLDLVDLMDNDGSQVPMNLRERIPARARGPVPVSTVQSAPTDIPSGSVDDPRGSNR